MSQKKVGILLSYGNLALGMLVNIFLTPMMISYFGDVEYSIYKVMQSFAGPLTVFHFGVSAIVTRCVVTLNSNDKNIEREKQNTIAIALLSSGVMAMIVIFASLIMYYAIPSIYGKAYDESYIVLGQHVFILFVLSTIFHILIDAFSGCIVGHEKFIATSLIAMAKNVAKIIFVPLLIRCGSGILFVTAIDFIVAFGTFIFAVIYSTVGLKEIPKLTYFDKKQVVDIFSFGMACFLQTIVNQVNNNMDVMILGAYDIEKRIITMYSSALAVYSIYNSLVSVISNFFLPQAAKLISRNATSQEMTDFVITPGRYQAIIAVVCVFGFALFGKNFICIWIGEKYINAYYITLMLMIPVTIPLVESAAISILDVTLKRMYRSVVLFIMAIANCVVSIALIKVIGFWGAAVGTALSLIIGHGFLMNIYYSKMYGMQICRMFKEIFEGVLPAGIIATLLCVPLSIYVGNTVALFFVKCTTFFIIYFTVLWKFGLRKVEKKIIKKMLRLDRFMG